MQPSNHLPSYISKYEALLRATSTIQEPWWITNIDNVLSQSVFDTLKHYQEVPLSGAVSALESIQKNLDITKVNYSGVSRALETFQTLQDSVLNSIPFAQSVLSQTLLDAVSHALTLSEPYLTPETQEAFEEKIQPQIEEEPKKQLTLSEILTLLTLLVSIYSAIIASRPNEQLERIIQQNQTIIEQQAEMIELNSEDKALYEALDSLTDSINLLSDEVDLLREQLEDPDDPADSSSEVDHTEGQQDDSDTQDDTDLF